MKKSLLCFLLLLGVVCVGCQNKDNSDKAVVEEKEAVVEEIGGENVGEENNFNDEKVSEEDEIFGEGEDFNVFFEKGKELLEKGNVKEAIEQFNKSLKINDKADWVYGDLGRAKKENNDFDGAVECYTKAIELNNNRPIYYEWRADVYNLSDKKDLAEKDMQKASELRAKGME